MKFNKEYIYDTTKKIMAIASPTGYTKNAIAFIENEVKAYGYKTEHTNKGNFLVYVPSENGKKTVGLSAHTDTLGLMVRSIKDDGKLAVTKLGGIQMPTLDGEYCTIITREGKEYRGTVLSNSPASHVYPDANTVERKEDTMEVRIDEKVKTKEDVEALGIQNGDIVAIDTKTEITSSDFVKSRFLDDKISVSILLELLKEIHEGKIQPTVNLIFMFSTYEEVGHGASYIPSEIEELLAVDMGCIGLDLSCTEYDVSICAKDSSGPYDYELTSKLIALAKKNKLQHAVDIYPFYGSDVSAALRGGNNIRGGLIGPGVHASHGMERTHYEGIENTLQLLESYVTNE